MACRLNFSSGIDDIAGRNPTKPQLFCWSREPPAPAQALKALVHPCFIKFSFA
jgi:hypothetical protein